MVICHSYVSHYQRVVFDFACCRLASRSSAQSLIFASWPQLWIVMKSECRSRSGLATRSELNEPQFWVQLSHFLYGLQLPTSSASCDYIYIYIYIYTISMCFSAGSLGVMWFHIQWSHWSHWSHWSQHDATRSEVFLCGDGGREANASSH